MLGRPRDRELPSEVLKKKQSWKDRGKKENSRRTRSPSVGNNLCMCYGCRKALEAKAALYDRLCEGEGLRGRGSDSEGEEEEEGRYMVDFTRKIVEEV